MAETLRELAVSLTLDSDNFSQNIKLINKQMKEAQSAFNLAGAGVKGFESTTAGVSEKLSMLREKQSLQNKAVEQYRNALNAANAKVETAVKNHQQLSAKLEDAKKRQAEMQEQVKNANKAWKDAIKQYGDNSDEANKLGSELLELKDKALKPINDEVEKLEGQLISNGKSMRAAANDSAYYSAKLNNAEAELKQISAEIDNTNKALKNMESMWYRAEKALKSYADGAQRVGKATQKVGKTLTRDITMPILALGSYAMKAQIDFESAFAGVRKTVDATEKEYAQLEQSIKSMSLTIPSTTEDLAGVMEIAGQLGILKNNLTDYTQTVIALDNSTNLSAEDAATQIAQFANVTGMAQENVGNLGSALVALGNNFATNEESIMSMASRLAAAGAQIGLSEAQILGFATALSSVGLEAEAGGSAFSKAMVAMQVAVETGNDSLKDFADVSGMTVKAFTELWKSNPASAIESFITGLSRMNEEGISSIVTLQEMGFTEIRLRDTLLRATNASELFANAQKTAATAWTENTALMEEAKKRYETTASKLQILKNQAKLAAQEVGNELSPMFSRGIETAGGLIDKFMALDTRQKEQIIKWAGIAAAAGPSLVIFGKIASGSGKVATGLLTVSRTLAGFAVAHPAIAATTLAIAALTAGITALSNRAPEYQRAIDGLFAEIDPKKAESFKQAFDATIVTNISVDDYQTKIDSAIQGIRDALAGVESLDPNQRAAIEIAIANGTGIDLLQDALEGMNIDPAKTTEIITAISTATSAINTELESLGLSEEAKKKIQAVAEAGGDLKSALESYGVPEGQAEQSAETITNAMATIGTAVDGIGLDDTQRGALISSALSDSAAIQAAMRLMGVQQSTIDTVLASYDTLNGSLSAKISGVYSAVGAALTDGLPDTDETVKSLEEQIRALYSGLTEDVQTWANEEIAKLDINSDTYTTDVETIKTKGAEMIAELQRQQESTLEFIKVNAGQSTANVLARLGELEQIEQRAREVTAEIDTANAKVQSEGAKASNIVKSGVTLNEDTAGRAFSYAQQTYQNKMAEIQAQYEIDLKNLESLGTSAYEAGIGELESNYASMKDAALDAYQSEIGALLNGLGQALLDAEPEAAAKLQEAARLLKLKDELEKIQEQILEGTQFEPTQLSDEIVKAFGFGDANELATALNNAIAGENYDERLNISALYLKIRDAIESSMEGLDTETGMASLATIIQGVIENGITNDIEGIDLTTSEGKMIALFTPMGTKITETIAGGISENASTATTEMETLAGNLIKSAGDGTGYVSVGQNYVIGIINGIRSKRKELLDEVKKLSNSVLKATKVPLAIASPSKKAEEIGVFYGQGLEIGMKKERAAVAKAAQYLADAATTGVSTQLSRGIVDNRNQSANVTIQNYNVSGEQDVNALAQSIDSMRRRRNRGYGLSG